MKRNLWSLCVLAFVIVLAGTARADVTVTLTSTADFDAGTKAPTTDENLGIETSTDNLGIATGAFELGSLKGDSFGTASVDANTAKWNIFHRGISCTSQVESIAAGVLNVDVQAAGVAPDCGAGVVASASVTSDWDVNVKVDKTSDVGATSLWELSMFSSVLTFCGGITDDGVHYRDVDGALQFYTCINSVYLQIGTNTATPADPIWLRITRATNTFTAFYSTDGTIWTQDEQVTTALIPNPLFPFVTVYGGSVSGQTGADFDNWHVSSGTLGAGGFRTDGQWTSATQTDTDPDEITDITVTYSGASASNYITSMTLLSGADATLFFDGTDITSGTTQSYAVPTISPGANWKVRLNMTGDGTGTPTVTAIVITAETPASPPTGCLGESIFGSILFAIFGTIAGVALVAAMIHGLRDEKGFDVETVAILIISIVVLLGIVAGFLGAFNTGATLGC